MPGTSANLGNVLLAIIPQGCSATYNAGIDNCSNQRGYLFASNKSSTWSTSRLQNKGLYALDTYVEAQLGLTGNGYYGFDRVSLGLSGSQLPTLENQLVAGIADNNYWLGSFPLSPYPHNFTNLNSPVQSMLSTLRNTSEIGSTSWGYTAGASYLTGDIFGSLTLGGYDQAQFDASTTLDSIPFGSDFTRDLLVEIRSITYDTLGSSPLLAQSTYAFIDSMVTQMWLPTAICKGFESAFGLQWDSDTELYSLSDSQHQTLLDQKPEFTFTLGSGSNTVDITLPYAAFDLTISPPLVAKKTHYFPLKQAQNDSTITLGRVFLQEAYVIADYDRQQFSVSQAAHPGSGVSQDIKALTPPGASSGNSSDSASSSNNNSSSGIGTGTTAAIAVAAVAIVALIGVVWFFLRRKSKKNSSRSELPGEETYEHRLEERKPGSPGTSAPLVAEVDGEGLIERYEAGGDGKVELDASNRTHYEMPDQGEMAEKDGVETPRAVEMDAENRYEMDAGDSGWKSGDAQRGGGER